MNKGKQKVQGAVECITPEFISLAKGVVSRLGTSAANDVDSFDCFGL